MENSTVTNRKDDELEISLYDICVAIFRKKFMIVLIVAVCLALACTYLHFASPVYETSASVMVSSLSSDSQSLSSLMADFSGSGQTEIATEVALLTSRRTIDEALSSLDLSRYTDPDGVPYDSLEFPLTAQGLLAGDVITVSTVTDTNIVEITVRDTDPNFAADLANAVAESFNEVLTNFARSSSTASIDFVESQIPLVRQQFDDASRALADFQMENSVLQTTQASQVSLLRYNYLVSRRAPLVLEEGEADAIIAVAPFDFDLEAFKAREDVKDALGELRARQEELLSYDLMALSSGVASNGLSSGLTTSQSDRYYVLTNSIQTIERGLESLVVSTLSTQGTQDASIYAGAVVQKLSSESEIALVDDQIAAEDEALQGVPELEMQLASLQSDVQVYQAMVVSLMQMEQEARLRAAAISDNVTLIDSALVPERPVSPNTIMVLAVAFVLGGFIGVGIALLLELNDKAIFSTDDLRKALPPETPFLGWLPMLKVRKNDRYVSSVVLSSPSSFESEKYKLIASNIIFGRASNNRVITVCSTDKNEGKTSVMANMAIALTQNGYNVLLVDGDLRMPSCEQYFNLEHQERGLVDIVMDGESLDGCIIQPFVDVEKLHLLPCGKKPAIPSMVYSAESFAKLVDTLKRRYDIILFDAPPLAYASELLALTKHAPEVLIVCRAGITNKNVLADMIETFRSSGATVIGACLNAVIASHGYGKSGYGNYSYYSSSKDPQAMASIVKSIPWFSSRKMYYRRRYKRDERYRGSRSTQKKIRPTHPFRPDLDLVD